MAENNYPFIPASRWWQLRKNFVQKIPQQVTPSYIAATLQMKEGSARTNIIPSLIQCGIIDEDGNTTDRAIEWRDDNQYPKVCEQIMKEVYPQELLDAFPGNEPDRDGVQRWFANTTGGGIDYVRKITAIYMLLADGDPAKEKITSARTRKPTTQKITNQPTKPKTAPKKKIVSPNATPQNQYQSSMLSTSMNPSLHVDIQIHIAPDATADQIDQIFASMAKHLYQRDDE